ncbi:MAG: flagellar basal body protein [Ilumatobacter sp.]|uniref:flagellar basal body rod protein FlgB n=1 Tax=Ilumatobacter sp. TaxID=1967498 RepID=UPI0026117AB7|nr:flagellar basal body protein [Ilumatobacter sp.]MDJ0767454.1 flagellar basal body protein [Ilumatobacter sp.]
MTISPISDLASSALRAALDGLDRRQQAIAANIANLETPGYLAEEVRFEDSLRAAIAAGDPAQSSVTVDRSLAPTRLNGSNVNIDMEVLAASENVLRQRLAIQGLNAKYQLLRTAITGR